MLQKTILNELKKGPAASIKKLRMLLDSLSHLDLSWEKLECSAIIALAEAMKENHSITRLYLSGNLIGDNGVTALAKMLENNYALSKLDVSWNQIGSAGALALVFLFPKNKTLTSVRLDYNPISKEKIGVIDEINSAVTINREGPQVHYMTPRLAVIANELTDTLVKAYSEVPEHLREEESLAS